MDCNNLLSTLIEKFCISLSVNIFDHRMQWLSSQNEVFQRSTRYNVLLMLLIECYSQVFLLNIYNMHHNKYLLICVFVCFGMRFIVCKSNQCLPAWNNSFPALHPLCTLVLKLIITVIGQAGGLSQRCLCRGKLPKAQMDSCSWIVPTKPLLLKDRDYVSMHTMSPITR